MGVRLATPAVAKNYEAEYLAEYEEKGCFMKVKLRVFPMSMSPEEILNENSTFHLSRKQAAAISDPFIIKVTLRNLKDEAKDEEVESGISDGE